MRNSINFSGKRILITGAAAGIGKETAMLLGHLGAKTVLLDSDQGGLKALTKALPGSDHYSCQYDLANIDGIEAKLKEFVVQGGAFDGLVHCVGIRSRRPLSLLTSKISEEVMRVNFISFIELVRCITKKNHYHPGLSIVGISSISSQRGGLSVTAYAASKGAMDSAVRCLAKELAPKSIRINTVVPAQINTPAYERMTGSGTSTEDITLQRQYLGLGEPIDVANAIAFLMSDQARFITGAAIPVDGGFLSS